MEPKPAKLSPTIVAILYYVGIFGLTALFANMPGFRSDMCNPGFDFLMIMLSPLGALGLLIYCGISYKSNRRRYLPAIILHSLFVFFFGGFILISIL